MTELERFLSFVDIHPSGCWIWTGSIDKDGYGKFWFRGKTVRAHRAGRVLYGVRLHHRRMGDHKCRVRACVNPAHIEPATHKENTLRGESFAAVNARKTHCIRGHEFSADNTALTGLGRRVCKLCVRMRRQAKKLVYASTYASTEGDAVGRL